MLTSMELKPGLLRVLALYTLPAAQGSVLLVEQILGKQYLVLSLQKPEV